MVDQAKTVLGLWLDTLGITPLIIDHVDRFLPLGHYITLKGHGVEFIRQMGLLDMARA